MMKKATQEKRSTAIILHNFTMSLFSQKASHRNTNKKSVVIDDTSDNKERKNYSVIDDIKNVQFWSPKYK